MNKKEKKTRTIAPRLKSGDIRAEIHNRLPPEIKAGLRLIAEKERKSVSWVLEEVVIDYFSMRRPKYVSRRNNEAN